MRYLDRVFSLPTARKPMSDKDYEIAVGLRCAKCKQTECKCKKK